MCEVRSRGKTAKKQNKTEEKYNETKRNGL